MLNSSLTTELKSTREAYGDVLVEVGEKNEKIVVFDAETSNSTFSEKFKKIYPERFFEMFIAEQNMISVALGMSKMGFIPFVSSFAAFLSRAFDQMRMAQYSNANLKIVGSHCGVSIGADGPSQMALEDLAWSRSLLQSVVFYPSDYYQTKKLTEVMANNQGLFYLRLTRSETPTIYRDNQDFKIGGSFLHQNQSMKNFKNKVLLITAGITLFEGLKAQEQLVNENIDLQVLDCYSIKPLDETTVIKLTSKIKNVIVIEDHYPYGGLGEAVSSLFTTKNISLKNYLHLAVKKIPMSGTSEELLSYMEIDSQAIIKASKSFF
ncbi:MAG: hypothetical protein Fur009_6840 [Candidatus Microgenomates bacterium]